MNLKKKNLKQFITKNVVIKNNKEELKNAYKAKRQEMTGM